MTRSSSIAGVFAAAAVVLSWVAAGCTPSAGGYCKKVCECTSCDEATETSCVDTVGDAEHRASQKQCGSQFGAFFSCVDAKTTCDTALTGCDAEQAALQSCAGEIAFGFGGGCVTFCTRSAKECGGGDGSQCASQCAILDQTAANAGCTSQYNDFLGCYAQLENICSGFDQCSSEVNTYTQCIISYCNQNPGSPGC